MKDDSVRAYQSKIPIDTKESRLLMGKCSEILVQYFLNSHYNNPNSFSIVSYN